MKLIPGKLYSHIHKQSTSWWEEEGVYMFIGFETLEFDGDPHALPYRLIFLSPSGKRAAFISAFPDKMVQYGKDFTEEILKDGGV